MFAPLTELPQYLMGAGRTTMARSSKSLIAELQRNHRFMGTCRGGAERFRLADATLFGVGDEPPEAVLAVISAVRQSVRHRCREPAGSCERMTQRAQATAQAVNLVKDRRRDCTFIPELRICRGGDYRALFEPIDYLVFSGLTQGRQIEAIHFVDVKSGAARLTSTELDPQKAVKNGNLEFDTMRVDREGNIALR